MKQRHLLIACLNRNVLRATDGWRVSVSLRATYMLQSYNLFKQKVLLCTSVVSEPCSSLLGCVDYKANSVCDVGQCDPK